MSLNNVKEFKKNLEISDLAYDVCAKLTDKLTDLGYFINKKDVYRAAICIAINNNLEFDTNVIFSNNIADTNAVFFENNANISELMLLFGYKQDEIFYYGRMLAEAGLKFLNQKILNHSDILDILVNNKM
jgi:hypothetical protein